MLSPTNHSIESPASEDYNCIGWACGSDSLSLWPGSEYHEWSPDLPQEETIPSFIALFEQEGYQLCDTPDFEDGFEKIAIFAKDNEPTHAARQVEGGRWTSKMGYRGVDIEHDGLEAIEGPYYGHAIVFLRRARGR